MSIVKRTNPEVIDALWAQRRERKENEKTVGIKDLPIWLIILLSVAAVISYIGWFGAFSLNPLVETLLSVLIVVFLIYYFLYKRRVRNKKYGVNSDSPNPSTQH